MPDVPTTNKKKTATYRWVENGHVLLWLLKDTCWALEWKVAAIAMVAPTIFVAYYLLWRSRTVRADRYHNLAVCSWITGNSLWMTGEFYKTELRPVAVCIFAVGLAVLAWYYIVYFKQDRDAEANAE